MNISNSNKASGTVASFSRIWRLGTLRLNIICRNSDASTISLSEIDDFNCFTGSHGFLSLAIQAVHTILRDFEHVTLGAMMDFPIIIATR